MVEQHDQQMIYKVFFGLYFKVGKIKQDEVCKIEQDVHIQNTNNYLMMNDDECQMQDERCKEYSRFSLQCSIP